MATEREGGLGTQASAGWLLAAGGSAAFHRRRVPVASAPQRRRESPGGTGGALAPDSNEPDRSGRRQLTSGAGRAWPGRRCWSLDRLPGEVLGGTPGDVPRGTSPGPGLSWPCASRKMVSQPSAHWRGSVAGGGNVPPPEAQGKCLAKAARRRPKRTSAVWTGCSTWNIPLVVPGRSPARDQPTPPHPCRTPRASVGSCSTWNIVGTQLTGPRR